jgi:hypothetical protein
MSHAYYRITRRNISDHMMSHKKHEILLLSSVRTPSPMDTKYIYIYTHTYIHYTCIYIDTYIHTHVHTYIHACIHAYIHSSTCIHTNIIHTYIHTYVRMVILNSGGVFILVLPVWKHWIWSKTGNTNQQRLQHCIIFMVSNHLCFWVAHNRNIQTYAIHCLFLSVCQSQEPLNRSFKKWRFY